MTADQAADYASAILRDSAEIPATIAKLVEYLGLFVRACTNHWIPPDCRHARPLHGMC